MTSLSVADLVISAERPVIIVPITGATKEQILTEAQAIVAADQNVTAGIIEWRIDHFENHHMLDQVNDMLTELRTLLAPRVILATFRTQAEGGVSPLDDNGYLELCQSVIASGHADLIDVEYQRSVAAAIIHSAQEHNVPVVGSNHDFHATPSAGQIVLRLKEMANMGCSVPKVAVMPQSPADVLELLSATIQASQELDVPIITMSMKELGLASRLTGGLFGSAATFATVGAASAPGQIPLTTLDAVFASLYPQVNA